MNPSQILMLLTDLLLTGAYPPETLNPVIDGYLNVAGDDIDEEIYGDVMQQLSYKSGGLSTLTIVMSHLNAQQVVNLPDFDMNFTLENILKQLEPNVPEAPAAFAQFMETFSAQLSVGAIEHTLNFLVYNSHDSNKLEALAVLMNNINAEMVINIHPDAWGNALVHLVELLDHGVTEATASIAQLMQTAGSQISGYAIGDAMQFLTYSPDGLAALRAIMDNLTEDMVTDIASSSLNRTLMNLVELLDHGVTEATASIKQLMQTAGSQISGEAIGEALQFLTYSPDGLAALSAIMDNVTPEQLASHTGDILKSLAFNAPYFIPAPVAGDFNGDGSVNLADYSVWRDNMGATGANAADANHDGVVDKDDYSIMKENFGRTEITVEDVIRDLMSKAADRVDILDLRAAVQELAFTGQEDCLEAIIDNLNDGQVETLALNGFKIGTDQSDVAFPQEGTRFLYGDGGDDFLIVNKHGVAVYGGEGKDALINANTNTNSPVSETVHVGGAGDDTIVAGGGSDTIYIGKGDGIDTVLNFGANGHDRLVLDEFLTKFDATQDAIEDFIILTHDAAGTTTVSVNPNGGGAEGATVVAYLQNTPADLEVREIIASNNPYI